MSEHADLHAFLLRLRPENLLDVDLSDACTFLLDEIGVALGLHSACAYHLQVGDGSERLGHWQQNASQPDRVSHRAIAPFLPWWKAVAQHKHPLHFPAQRHLCPAALIDALSSPEPHALLLLPVSCHGKVVLAFFFIKSAYHAEWQPEEELLIRYALDTLARSLEYIQVQKERQEAVQNLKNAMEQASAALQAKDDFLAKVSHEIRTPMSAIMGYSDLLASPTPAKDAGVTSGTAPPPTEIAAAIRRNAEHLLALVNDVLDISKIASGHMRLAEERCNLFEVIEDVATTLRFHAQEKLLAFQVGIHPNVPQSIRTDPVRLRQILLNLATNAIKFTPQGRVDLQVYLERQTSQLRFDVIDTGIGIPKERMADLFTPFTQLHADTHRTQGTGLGLSISGQLACLLGGSIKATSKPGEGSTFSLIIPCTVDATPIPGLAERPATRPRMALPEGALRGRKVLLVDDGPDNQRIITFYLHRVGAEVVGVSNGEEAVRETLRAQRESAPYDLILMDMMMPIMDGYAATRRLRASQVTTPIVALTAYAMLDDRNKALEAGCDEYISKPIDPRHFFDLLLSLLPPVAPSPTPQAEVDEAVGADLASFHACLPQLQQHLRICMRDRDISGLVQTCNNLRQQATHLKHHAIAHSAAASEDHLESGGLNPAAQQSLQDLLAHLDAVTSAIPIN